MNRSVVGAVFFSFFLFVFLLSLCVRVSCYADLLLWIAFHSCTNNVLYRYFVRRRNFRATVKRNLIQFGYTHYDAHLHRVFHVDACILSEFRRNFTIFGFCFSKKDHKQCNSPLFLSLCSMNSHSLKH